MTTADVRPLSRDEGIDLAAVEYDRITELLTGLPEAAWSRPTDCPDWDVRELVSHIVGIAEFGSSFRETVRQLRAGRRTGRPAPDGMNEVQVRERAERSPAELIAELRARAPRAVGARRRLPRPLRRVPLPADAGGSLDRLLTVVLLRDAWMHRIDLAHATGASLLLTPDHDGRIIADVVADWAGQHQEPYDLMLTGAAGGHFGAGTGGTAREFDAVEFARILAGRATADGLPPTQVIF